MLPEARTGEFAIDQDYDAMLREMNGWLSEVETRLTERLTAPRWPVVFVVGPPRSGTTVLTQLLAATGAFAYPSNLIARFYKNLYIGGRIERILRRILPEGNHTMKSNLGKTERWFEPSEMGFFWKTFFPALDDHEELSEDDLRQSDPAGCVRELAALEASLGKPVMIKAMILHFNIPFLHQILPKAIFVRIRREHLSGVLSILEARKRAYGTVEPWIASKPQNWRELAKLKDPVEQIVAQLASVESSLDRGMAAIPAANGITVEYEKLCANTHGVMRQVQAAMQAMGCEAEFNYSFPPSLEATRRRPDDPAMLRHIESLFKKYGLTMPGDCARPAGKAPKAPSKSRSRRKA